LDVRVTYTHGLTQWRIYKTGAHRQAFIVYPCSRYSVLITYAPLYRAGVGIVITHVCMSVCPSVRKMTHERVGGCRPNMIGLHGQGVTLKK